MILSVQAAKVRNLVIDVGTLLVATDVGDYLPSPLTPFPVDKPPELLSHNLVLGTKRIYCVIELLSRRVFLPSLRTGITTQLPALRSENAF